MIKTKLSSSRKESYRTMDGWESFLMCDARFLIFFIRGDCSDFEMAHSNFDQAANVYYSQIIMILINFGW